MEHFLAQTWKGKKKKKGSRKALDGKLRHVCCSKNIAHMLRLALQAFSIQCSFKNLKGKNCARDRQGNCGTRHKLLTKRCWVTNSLFESSWLTFSDVLMQVVFCEYIINDGNTAKQVKRWCCHKEKQYWKHTVTHWMVIYLVDRVIHPHSNSEFRPFSVAFWCFSTTEDGSRNYWSENLVQVVILKVRKIDPNVQNYRWKKNCRGRTTGFCAIDLGFTRTWVKACVSTSTAQSAS